MNRTSTIFKSAHRRALFSAMTVLVALVVVAVPTLAFPPPGGAPASQGSPFNAGDAVPSCPPGADPLSLNTATTGSSVTPVNCTETGGAKAVTVDWISDTLSGSSTDNAWGQGDKSDCYLAKGSSNAAGACVTQVFGIGASKTDLQYHGVGLEKGTDCTDVTVCPAGVNEATHDYLYSGIKRLQAGGITSSNANYNVEINQKLPAYEPASPICPLATGTGSCNIWRSPGDLTFMTDWGGNQSSCGAPTPAICAYVWIDKSTGTGKTPSPAGSTCFNAKTDPCWGLLPGGNAKLSENALLADGSINSGAADQPFTFSEIAVDLTASGLVPAGTCFNAKDVWAHSRSSSSFTAELKDFIFGNVELNTCSTTSTSLQQRSGPDTDPTATNVGSAALELTVAPGSWVRDTATVSAGATGNVTFRYYTSADLCNAGTATSGGTFVSTNALSGATPNTATSATVQFSTVGDFYWRAFYLGDGLSPSASPCNEIVHVVQVNTAISTAPWIYPNDKATITNPNGGGTPTGSVKFRLYDTAANCGATTPSDTVGTGGLLYREIVALPASSPFTVNTANTSVKVESTATVWWRVEFTSTNASQKGRNSLCVENINATLTPDAGPGTVGNTP